MSAAPNSRLDLPSTTDVCAREAAEQAIYAARKALQAERNPNLVPLRRSQLAWALYQCSCLTKQKDSRKLIDAALFEGETAFRAAVGGSFAAYWSRIVLANILIGSVTFVGCLEDDKTPAYDLIVPRAAMLAQQAMDECRRQNLEMEHLIRASDLIMLTSRAQNEFLGDPTGLQAAIEQLSNLYAKNVGGPQNRLHFAVSVSELRYSHFELTGDIHDLNEAIKAGEDALSDLFPYTGNGLSDVSSSPEQPLSAMARSAIFVVSNSRASRSQLACVAAAVGDKADPTESKLYDAQRAVTLARRLVAETNLSGHSVATANNALGFALRAFGFVTNDPSVLREALHHFLTGLHAANEGATLKTLLVNNAATLLGELQQVEISGNVALVSDPLDEAIIMLSKHLRTKEGDFSGLGFSEVQALFNYGELLVRRRMKRVDYSLTTQAIDALTVCLRMLPAGHPRRAQALSLLAIGLTFPESLATLPNAVELAVDAALEAEAIHDSGAPSTSWIPDCLPLAEEAWRRSGHDMADLSQRRVSAVRLLVDSYPRYAINLSTARGNQALGLREDAIASDYADIACDARDRAMIIADDPVAGTTFALGHGVDTLARNTACAIATSAPERAALLLERAQGSVIGRLQLSLAAPDLSPQSANPALIDYFNSREQLKAILIELRKGALVATPEAIRTANEELATAIEEVRRCPGMEDFLIHVTDVAAWGRVGRGCLYLAAGETQGVGILHKENGVPQVVMLPLLNNRLVEVKTKHYLEYLDRLEHDGVSALSAFQDVLDEIISWLGLVVWSPVKEAIYGEFSTVIPCGLLAALPLGGLTNTSEVTYSPSAQIRRRTQKPANILPILLVCDPGHDDQSDIPNSGVALQWIEALANAPVSVLRGKDATPGAVINAAKEHSTIVFYAHGTADVENPLAAGILLNGTSRLDVRTVFANSSSFSGRTIVLAACSQGRIDTSIPGEMLGPATAFLAAGAATVIAPAWPTEALSAQNVAMTFLEARMRNMAPAEALVASQRRVADMGFLQSREIVLAGLRQGRVLHPQRLTGKLDFRHPFFSAAFSAYG